MARRSATRAGRRTDSPPNRLLRHLLCGAESLRHDQAAVGHAKANMTHRRTPFSALDTPQRPLASRVERNFPRLSRRGVEQIVGSRSEARETHESTTIHLPPPRWTTTHSPTPGPKSDTSSSSLAGGSVSIFAPEEIVESFGARANTIEVFARPGGQTPELDLREALANTSR